METNVYEEAYKIQNQLIDLVAQKQSIDEQIKNLNDEKERLIAQGDNAPKIGEFNLIVNRKTTEKRTINMDALKRHPDIVFGAGTLKADFVMPYVEARMRNVMMNDPDFEKGYKLGLGELDKACGGKKESAEFCDVDITEKIERTISRMRAPIIEV